MTSYLIKIETVDITNLLKQPDGYKLERNKLWTDANRVLSGKLKAVLIGVFPKLVLNFIHLTEDQLQDVAELLDPAIISVEFYNYKTKTTQTANFYASDYGAPLFIKDKGLYSPFTVSLIPYDPE